MQLAETLSETSESRMVQRLDRLETSVALIEEAVIRAQEEGSFRHEEMVSRLSELKEDIINNHKILKKLRDRGCFSCLQSREFVFVLLLLVLSGWIYFLQKFKYG